MKKNIPPFHDFTKQEPSDVVRQVRTYELITPLFGGGVNPSEVDMLTPIRGSEIRGHLRFWWRACRGGRWENLRDLKDEEDKIWGKAYKKGEDVPEYDALVHVVVENEESVTTKAFEIEPVKDERGQQQYKRNGQPQYRSVVNRESGVPPYAAFPLQPQKEELDQNPPPEPKKVGVKIEFTLKIAFPKDRRDDIEAALWAWETFGGIGARTRRGFGALRCTGIKERCADVEGEKSLPLDLPAANPRQVLDWLQRQLKTYVVAETWNRNVPHLRCRLVPGQHLRLIPQLNGDALEVWRYLIGRLQSFRQMRPRRERRSPGRSRWPEPSAIRERLEQHSRGHESPIPNNPVVDKFPRAEFGLPIIFKFKDDNQKDPDNENVDPRKTVLQPQGYERFASPLILKPLACKEGKVIGLAYILAGPRPGNQTLELDLETKNSKRVRKSGPPWKVKAYLDKSEKFTLQGPGDSSSIDIDHQTDILQAFLKYL